MHETSKTVLQRENYRPAYPLRYPKRIIFISYFIFLISGSLFYIIWSLEKHRRPFPGITPEELSGITILVYAIAEFLHILLQRGMSRLFGYRVSIDFSRILTSPETYTGDPGQFQKRNTVLLIAIVPLILFILLWIPLLVGLQGTDSDILAYFLFVNLSRSLGDLYFIRRLFQTPRRTLLYIVSSREKLIFEPAE